MKNVGSVGGYVWHALRVPPQQRLMELVVRILRGRGMLAGIPMEKRLRRRTKRDKERRLIAYTTAPGYVFVGFPADQPFPWRAIFTLHMVHSVVSINGRPADLNHKAVMRFLNYEQGDLPGYSRHVKTGREFAPGDSVYVSEGPLTTWTQYEPMRVSDIRDGEAFFLIRLMGKEMEVGVAIDACVKAEAA